MKTKRDIKYRVTGMLAEMLQRELDSICPEESMSRSISDDDKEFLLEGVRVEDGRLVLAMVEYDVMKGPADKHRELILKPVGWREA